MLSHFKMTISISQEARLVNYYRLVPTYPSIRWLLGSCALFAPCHPFIRRSCPSDGTLACGFLVGCISFLSCTGMYAVEYIWATFRRTGAFLWQVPIHSKAALLTPHYGSELHWCSIYQSISRSQGRSLQPIEIRCVEHSYCCRYLYVPHPIQCIVNSDLEFFRSGRTNHCTHPHILALSLSN